VIVYQASKSQFVHDTFRDDIEHVLSQQYLRTTGRKPSPSEFTAWKHSLFEVGEVLKDPGIPDDMGVALGYTVPQTAKRIDVLLTGETEGPHPSYQGWSYAALLIDFNTAVYDGGVALAAYLRSRLGQQASPAKAVAAEVVAPAASAKVLPLRRVSQQERAQGVPAVPVVSLKFAAVAFSDPQALEDGADDWVELPEWVKPQPGLFVAQVVGESMNKRIPNGAWCLFRANPQGTRNGKIVVVQHRSISDPETGGSYTIKRYRSEKVVDEDGGWRHERVELVPESTSPTFERIAVNVGYADLAVIAEHLFTLE